MMNNQNSVSNHTNVICGPIVGLVTCNSANILLEFDKDISDLQCSITDKTNGRQFNVHENYHLVFKAYEPKIIKFELPERKNNNNYTFIIRDLRVKNSNMHNANFHTFGTNCDRFNVITTSCNQVKSVNDWDNQIQNLWIGINQRVQHNDVDLVLHLGGQVDFAERIDQLLSDENFVQKANLLSSDNLTSALLMDLCECTRQTFTKPYINNVLSSAQNLMIYNSCESLQDYDVKRFTNKINVEVDLLNIAKNVYRKYQRSLWDIEFKNTPTQHSCHKWGRYGLFLLDIQKKQNGEHFLFKDQVSDIRSFCSDSKLEILMLGTNMPILSNFETNSSLHVRWPSKDKIFKMVHRYLEKVQREIPSRTNPVDMSSRESPIMPVILSGYCPSAIGKTVITHKDGKKIMQLCVGPVCGSSNNNCDNPSTITSTYKKQWNISYTPARCNNYGILVCDVQNGKNNVAGNLVRANDVYIMNNARYESFYNTDEGPENPITMTDVYYDNNDQNTEEELTIYYEGKRPSIDIEDEESTAHPAFMGYYKTNKIFEQNNPTENTDAMYETDKSGKSNPYTIDDDDDAYKKVLHKLSNVLLETNTDKSLNNQSDNTVPRGFTLSESTDTNNQQNYMNQNNQLNSSPSPKQMAQNYKNNMSSSRDETIDVNKLKRAIENIINKSNDTLETDDNNTSTGTNPNLVGSFKRVVA